MSNTEEKMGVSGRLAAAFQSNAITPLLALVALLLGLFAVLVTPREEEPQINVTMANVLIPFPGASSQTVQNMVARPAEQVLSQIQGIEHTYSVARPGVAVLTVQFKVGVPRTEALVRLYDVLNANQDWLPRDLGTLTPIVKPKGIDDVPVLGVTLWSPEATSALTGAIGPILAYRQNADDGDRDQPTRGGNPGTLQKDARRVGIIEKPPPEECWRRINRQPGQREPGRAELRLKAKPPRGPLRRHPHREQHDGEHDDDLPPHDAAGGHSEHPPFSML